MELVYLVSVVKKNQKDRFVDFFKKNGVFAFEKTGKGTATSDMMAMLGITNRERSIIISMLPWQRASYMLNKIDGFLSLEPNSGVAFTVRMDALVGGKLVQYFRDKEGQQPLDISQERLMDKTNAFELIIALAAKGHVDTIMKAANEAGARGGTAVSAINANLAESEKFFNVEIGEQKEMVYILTASEKKNDIMQAIAKAAGPSTPARCIVFSMPVSAVAGI